MPEKMKTVCMVRRSLGLPECSEATLGVVKMPSGKTLFSIEPPWDANKPNVSCIPDGEYVCRRDRTGRFKYYKVLNVPERAHIEIHPANYYVNPTKGRQELHGCIALGMRLGNGRSVLSSKSACNAFLEEMGDNDFILNISTREAVL